MQISKIVDIGAAAAFDLTGVTKLTPAADMTFALRRKCAGNGAAWVAPGNAFQVNGLPLTSAASQRDMYNAQCLGSWAASGHITGTSTTRKFGSIDIVSPGAGYAVGDTFHLINNGLTGLTDPHDAVVTVVAVNPNGGIKDFTIADGTASYTLGFATAASDVLTSPTPATFRITQVGAFTAAVVDGIDVHANDIEAYETYKVFVGKNWRGTVVWTEYTLTTDYTILTGVVTFVPVGSGGKGLPNAGDWVKCVAYEAGTRVVTFTATEVGATPTVDPRSTSTGAKVIEVANPVAGALKTLAVVAAGTGYEVGDILAITQAGGSGGKAIVTTINAGAVTGVAILQAGSGYAAASGLPTVNEMAGSDDACTITITVGTAGEYVARAVTTTYALSGTGNLVVTFVNGAIPPAGELVRMCHTFALGNKITPEIGLDASCATAEVFKVTVDGTLQALTTDYTVETGPFIKFAADQEPTVGQLVHVFVQTNAMVCVQGDEIAFDHGVAGGYSYQYIVPTGAAVVAVSYD
jgi:hypothetical protein